MNLYRWRFYKAKETNRARFRVLSDQILLDLAKAEASTIEMLEMTGILAPEKISIYGPEIIKAVIDNNQF
jgi:ribonuclease D